MAEKDETIMNKQTDPMGSGSTDEGLDAGSKSLAEALRISFALLKLVMVLLLILFVASGFFTVGPDEQALVLRFGKIRGIGEDRLLGPGLHWSLPYPIDEQVIIPVKKVHILPIEQFWYFETESEKLGSPPKRVPRALNPIMDGYCITRNENVAGLAGNDYNIVHCKWQLTYVIDRPELFFRNIYLASPQPGQSFADVIPESIKSLLESLAGDAVVTTMVNFSIDDAILSKSEIADDVKIMLQDKLDEISSGIKVVSTQLSPVTWPRQVDEAFLRSIKAEQESERHVTEAKGYAENIMNEAGGPAAYEILKALKDSALSEKPDSQVWSQLAGTAQERIAEARAYRTKVVESAKADAEYLRKLLPEYRKRPGLVIQEIYQDAIEEVLENADEKIIVQPTADGKPREVRIQLNRDPSIKSKAAPQP
jgi:membrane protease subunit HflK